MFAFLRHIAEACADVGLRGLSGLVPFGSVVFDIASRALERYRESQRQDQIAADVEQVVRADLNVIRAEAAAIAREVASSHPPEIQLQLESYLTQIPSVARQSLRRPQDPLGKSVPAQIHLVNPVELQAILPQRPPQFRAGQSVPHGPQWVLEELLGAGGFGEVWLARHNFLDEHRAFKFCLDPMARDRLLRHEGEVVKRVMKAGVTLRPDEHGIVRLLDTYLDGETPWLAYEYVAGGDLAGLVRLLAARPPAKRAEVALRLLRYLAIIVGRLHRLPQPIIHRDLKPANVLIRQIEGRVILRVTDFGIGSIASDQALRQASVSTPSVMMGESLRGAHTPLYASPQQKRGHKPDVRDDVYALGIIGFQLLTGDLTAERPAGKWRKRLADSEVPDAILDLLESCWDDDPNERPADGIALAEQLKGRSQVAPRGAVATPVSVDTAPPVDSPSPAVELTPVVTPAPIVEPTSALEPIPEPTISPPPVENPWADVLADYESSQNCDDLDKWLAEKIAHLNRWRNAADTSIPEGMVLLGHCFDTGIGVEEDEATAAGWFRKAAELGNVDGMYLLGSCYETGSGVRKSLAQAARWYRKAAELGDREAMYEFGWMCGDGKGVPKNEVEAVGWYLKAAELGHVGAMNNLGWMYAQGWGVQQNSEEAIRWYKLAAKHGETTAMCNLGRLYSTGTQVQQDFEESLRWFQLAADHGDAEALEEIRLLQEGEQDEFDEDDKFEDEDEPKEFVVARECRETAEGGDAAAMNRLGELYAAGEGVARNKTEAARWFSKAAELGNLDGMCSLGLCYDNGSGVSRNKTKALHWLRQAADQGHSKAMFHLGLKDESGHGVVKDEYVAFQWFRRAAERGNADAMYCVGVMYQQGTGVEANEQEVIRWLREAAALNQHQAIEALQSLS